MAGGWISRALGLLDVRDSGGGQATVSRRGSGGGGGDSDKQGYAQKDMRGSSSAAQHNRRIYQKQLNEKAEEAYKDDPANEGKSWEDAKKEYDSKNGDGSFQKSQVQKYRPDLNSSAQSRRAAGQDQDKKDAARDAMREHVKSEEAKAEAKGKRWTHDDAEKARAEFKKGEDKETEDESKGTTADAGAAAEDPKGKTSGNKVPTHTHSDYLTRDEIQTMIDDALEQFESEYF